MAKRLSTLPLQSGPVTDDSLATVFEYDEDLFDMAYHRPVGTESWVPVRVEKGETLFQYWEFNLFYAPLEKSFHWLGSSTKKASGAFSAQWKESAQTAKAFSTGGQMDLIMDTNTFAQTIHNFDLTASVVIAMQGFDYADYVADQARILSDWLAENPVNWAQLYVAEAAEHVLKDFVVSGSHYNGHYKSFECACGHTQQLTDVVNEYDFVTVFAAHQAAATATVMATLIRDTTGY